MTHKYDIFLSYASEDNELAHLLYSKLEHEKYIVWYDQNEIKWGNKLDKEIDKGLENSRYGIVIISRNYLNEKKIWTAREFKYISNNDKILPILYEMTMNDIEKDYPNIWKGISNIRAIPSNVERGRSLDDAVDNIIKEAKKAIGSDSLCSEREINYTRLRDLLKAGNWKDADYETYMVMLKVVSPRKDGDWIRDEELLNFPCTDLRTIDSLWVKYSNERFGLSVQKKIYLDCGGIPDGKYYQKAWEKFGDRVGWRKGWGWLGWWIKYHEVTFYTSAPVGHLPVLMEYVWRWRSLWALEEWEIIAGCFPTTFTTLFSRVQACKL